MRIAPHLGVQAFARSDFHVAVAAWARPNASTRGEQSLIAKVCLQP